MVVTEEVKYLFVHTVVLENTRKEIFCTANSKLFVKIFFMHVVKDMKDNKHNSLHFVKNVLMYLSLDII